MKSDVTKAAANFTAKEALAVAAEAAAQEAWISWQADRGDGHPVALAMMAAQLAVNASLDAKEALDAAVESANAKVHEFRQAHKSLWNRFSDASRDLSNASLQWATLQRQDGRETEEFRELKAAWLLAAAEVTAAVEALEAAKAKDPT